MLPSDWIHLFLTLRGLHILAAALWLGSASFISFFLLPTLGQQAPETISKLVRKRFHIYMGVVGAVTILSGISLYCYVFGGAGFGSRAALVYGIAGTLGVASAIIGRAVIGTSAARIAELFEKSSAEARQGPDSAIAQRIGALQRRMERASRLGVTLMVTTLLLMVWGHYF